VVRGSSCCALRASTGNHYTANATLPPLIGFDATSETRWGASVGVGIEYAFAQNWSFGFEYNHLFMGNPDVISTPGFLIADHIKQERRNDRAVRLLAAATFEGEKRFQARASWATW
jgi:opacity protein-like surface antigen